MKQQHKNATKKFDYTMIADQLRMSMDKIKTKEKNAETVTELLTSTMEQHKDAAKTWPKQFDNTTIADRLMVVEDLIQTK